MVAAAAMAARAIGPKIASAGGKWMHSSNAGIRKMGSKMLGMGGGKDKDFSKLEGVISKWAQKSKANAGEMLKKIAIVSKTLAKVLGTLAKASPALKQQLIVMNKGIMLFLRPIGDIMAKFLRPMSVWVMKVAQKWYGMLGGGDKTGEMNKEDTLKQLKTEQESALIRGDTEGAAKIGGQIAALESDGGDAKGALGKIFKEVLPEAFRDALTGIGEAFAGIWEVLKQLGIVLWDVAGPGIKLLAEEIGVILIVALKAIEFVFKGLGVVLGWVAEGIKQVGYTFEILKYWTLQLISWIGDKLVSSFKSVVDWIGKVVEWIGTKLVNAFQWLLNGVKGFITWVKEAISKISFWKKNKDDDDADSKAVGGEIPQTGLYRLHAGERVLTAGDTSRANNSSSNTFNNVINIAATIANDIDIRDLARKLADINETELRRRVSY